MGATTTWTAADVKAKLRGRHAATQQMGVRTIPGAWTCIEEWGGIDLLALCAHSSGGVPGIRYPRVGYEVKVSRSDYRAELRKPHKRAAAVAMCHEFYFAVPRGLLRGDELPDGAGQTELGEEGPALYVPGGVGLVVVDGRGCSVVKRPPVNHDPDEIVGGETQVRGDGWGSGLHAFARWVSARPDPRHDGVVERARARSREIGALEREREAARAV